MDKVPRWLAAAFGVVVLILVAGGAWLYQTQERQLRQRIEGSLRAIARLKSDQVALWRAERLGDASALRSNSVLIEEVVRWTANPSAETAARILPWSGVRVGPDACSDILLVDTRGEVLVSRSGLRGKLHEDALNVLAESLRTGQPRLSDLHDGISGLPAHLDAIAPLFRPGTTPPEPLGAYVLQYNAGQFLFPLLKTWPTPELSPETILIRREGETVLFLNELRHRRGSALKLRFPLSREELPSVRAARGEEDVVEGQDYRGVIVFSALKAVPDSPWFIVVKIDKAEALASWRLNAALILALITGLLAAASATLGVVWQRNAKAHYRALFQAETARAESEARYRTMLMSVGDGIIATDAGGRVVLLNPVAESLTGWRQAEARGMLFNEVFRLVNEETRQPIDNLVEDVLRRGLVIGQTERTLLAGRDGSERPVSYSYAPILNESDQISGAIFVFHDQTAERRARAALESLTSRQQALLAAIPDIIMEVDAAKIYTWANQAGLDFFGENVIGREAAEYFEGDQQTYERVQPLFNGGESVIYLESWQRRKDNQKRLLAWWCRVLKHPDGTVAGALSSARDITEQKLAEMERERLRDQLLQSQKLESIGLLAGGVSHDFNNMLQVIQGYTDLSLSEIDPDHPLHENLAEIQKAAQRSARLTSQLLAFARKQPVCPLPLDLNDFVPAILSMFRRMIGEDIDLSWEPGPDLWSVLIDPSQVDQLLANLIINAREAIDGAGLIRISTANIVIDQASAASHPEIHAGDYVQLTVSDSGHGMDRGTLEHCLEPFFTTKGPGQGSGLGLATVYGIVKQNGGFIGLHSEPGQGAVFRICLPRSFDEAASPSAQEPETSPGGMETLLLVEDEQAILKQTEQNLRQLGYRVLTANSPGEAARLAASYAGPIQLLLTDVVLPEMNGLELHGRLAGLRPGLKCLYMSGYTSDVITRGGVLEEGLQFLQKPFTLKTLAVKVRQTLDN